MKTPFSPLWIFAFSMLIFPAQSIGQINPSLEQYLGNTTDDFFYGKSTRGLSATVYHHEENGYGYFNRGYSHVESGDTIHINSNMKFSLGSNGKLITSATILRLQELDSLDLEDSLGMYLPGLSANVSESITIRQLLTHTTGLADYINVPALVQMNDNYNQVWTPTELVQNFVGTPVDVPGSAWNYCNTNYLLAGMVIESIMNQPYHEVVRTLILEPNGLDELWHMGNEPIQGELAHAWDHGAFTYTTGDIHWIPHTSPGCFAYAAGAYWGTAKNMVDFYKAVFVDETMLSPTSLIDLNTTVLTPSPYNTVLGNYGLAVFIGFTQNMNVTQHTGSWWHLSAAAVDTDNGNIAVVCINDTEGLTTSVNYQGLAVELLKDMRYYDDHLGNLETDKEENWVTKIGNDFFLADTAASIEVFSLNGERIRYEAHTNQINLSDQPCGIYILKADDRTKKIFVD